MINLTKFIVIGNLEDKHLTDKLERDLKTYFNKYFSGWSLAALETLCEAQSDKEVLEYLGNKIFAHYITNLNETGVEYLGDLMLGCAPGDGRKKSLEQRKKAIATYLQERSAADVINDYCTLIKGQGTYKYGREIGFFMNEHLISKIDDNLPIKEIKRLFVDMDNKLLRAGLEEKLNIKLENK